MSGSSGAIKLSLALVSLLTVQIVLPAVLFGVARRWQVIFLLLSYVIFFQATIWRARRYGELTKTSEDEQYKRKWGRLALAVQFPGLLGVHWLALYDFSRFGTAAGAAENIFVTTGAIFSIAAAMIINQVAIRTLKKFFNRIAIEPDHRLVTSGIYSIVRHPIYLSYVLLLAGFCTMLHSLGSCVLLGLVCGVWLGSRIAIEEEMLLARFGDEYKAYRQKTKRLFPFIY